MPVLPNNKHELFAQGLAKGLSADLAYEQASYRPNRGNAARLKANESISGRVKELQEAAAAKAMVTKRWVLDRLKEVVERAMTAVPVLDGDGNPTGEYTYQGNVANRALELIGKELGMFKEKQPGDEDHAITLRVIDAPPRETREHGSPDVQKNSGLPLPPSFRDPQPDPQTNATMTRCPPFLQGAQPQWWASRDLLVDARPAVAGDAAKLSGYAKLPREAQLGDPDITPPLINANPADRGKCAANGRWSSCNGRIRCEQLPT